MRKYIIYVTVACEIEADSESEALDQAFLEWEDGDAIEFEVDHWE